MNRTPLRTGRWPGIALTGSLSLLALMAAVLTAPHAHAAASPVVAEGTLEIQVEDFPQASRTRHFLKTVDGRLELKFKGQAPALRGGERLRVRGQRTGSLLALDDSGSSRLTVTAAAPLAGAAGAQKTAVLLVNFANDTRQPYTVAQADDVVIGQVGAFMRENSFQSVWLTGRSFGWLTLPLAQTCTTSAIADAAKSAANAAGIDLAAYSRFVYVFPRNDSCGWSGVGTVGGASSDAWINGRLELKTVAHEIGHNFGLQHSHASDCDLSPLGDTCITQDYGDVADTMGTNTSGHYNAFQKERLGWLASGAQPPIATTTTGGRFSIGAYAAQTGSVKALKLPKGIDAATGAQVWYYVEYRQPIGFDAVLAGLYQTNLVSGVLIRTGTDGDRNSSYLLDMTPNTVPTFDMTDAALVPGQSFVDPASGVTITLAAADASQATVDVAIGAPSGCVRAEPALTLSTTSNSMAAGSAVGYETRVTNNDSAGCGASTFTLQSTPPAGWSGSFANPALALMPGAAASTTMTVTSSATAAAGSYAIAVGATHGASPTRVGTASAAYVVAAPLATSVAASQSSYTWKESARLSARVTSGGLPVAGAAVNFTLVKPGGGVVGLTAESDASGLATVTYRFSRKDPVGNWQFSGRASLNGASAEAASAFILK